jgi:rare lipoprotein A
MHGILILLVLWTGGAATMMAVEPTPHAYKQAGVASWYGAECKKTSTGKAYDPNSLTCAHRTLPIGTVIEIRNLDNGRTVVVRVNNRGPFCKRRILDVSKAAARQLDMIKSGTARVELAVVK